MGFLTQNKAVACEVCGSFHTQLLDVSTGPVCPSVIAKNGQFLSENHRGSPTLTMLNVLNVMNVLNVLNLPNVLCL